MRFHVKLGRVWNKAEWGTGNKRWMVIVGSIKNSSSQPQNPNCFLQWHLLKTQMPDRSFCRCKPRVDLVDSDSEADLEQNPARAAAEQRWIERLPRQISESPWVHQEEVEGKGRSTEGRGSAEGRGGTGQKWMRRKTRWPEKGSGWVQKRQLKVSCYFSFCIVRNWLVPDIETKERAKKAKW